MDNIKQYLEDTIGIFYEYEFVNNKLRLIKLKNSIINKKINKNEFVKKLEIIKNTVKDFNYIDKIIHSIKVLNFDNTEQITKYAIESFNDYKENNKNVDFFDYPVQNENIKIIDSFNELKDSNKESFSKLKYSNEESFSEFPKLNFVPLPDPSTTENNNDSNNNDSNNNDSNNNTSIILKHENKNTDIITFILISKNINKTLNTVKSLINLNSNNWKLIIITNISNIDNNEILKNNNIKIIYNYVYESLNTILYEKIKSNNTNWISILIEGIFLNKNYLNNFYTDLIDNNYDNNYDVIIYNYYINEYIIITNKNLYNIINIYVFN
jgi:hypothetical protein